MPHLECGLGLGQQRRGGHDVLAPAANCMGEPLTACHLTGRKLLTRVLISNQAYTACVTAEQRGGVGCKQKQCILAPKGFGNPSRSRCAPSPRVHDRARKSVEAWEGPSAKGGRAHKAGEGRAAPCAASWMACWMVHMTYTVRGVKRTM